MRKTDSQTADSKKYVINEQTQASAQDAKSENQSSERLLGWPTASAVVIASMVGVGVFSTLSFQVHALDSPFAILVLWFVGALIALAGALCYAELGAAMPRSGGEYHLLGEIFHPALGFVAGCVSLIAGFAAPIAAAAIAFAAYLAKVFPVLLSHQLWVAIAITTVISLIHAWRVGFGARFQVGATVLKIALMLVLATAALFATPVADISFLPKSGDGELIASSAFAVSLVYVSYAYSGWNAAVYIAGETRQPQSVLPKALALSTLLVGAIYLFVNYAFLRVVPISEMLQINPFAEGDSAMVSKELAVGFLAGQHIFGAQGAAIVGLLIALCLVSTISAMVLTGPRVMATMAQDYRALYLLKAAGDGAPKAALALQWLVIVSLLATASFEVVLSYIGVMLGFFASLTVLGMLVLRWRKPDLHRPFRCPGFPLLPLAFLAANGWMLYFLISQNPKVLLACGLTIALGMVGFALIRQSHVSVLSEPKVSVD
jgi:basic amino acid/polyamine antiporter, APA family